jgi:hypothetical protein
VSPCLASPNGHQLIIQRNYRSAAEAYNDALDRAENDLVVFCHQDIVFTKSWLHDLNRALAHMEQIDKNWGVLGCYGETLNDNGRGYVYSPGRGILGKQFDAPALVQTLDEIVLILRKSSGLRFSPELPHFHFYGADICMAAAERGMHSYAISALCIHNTQQNLVLPNEFYAGCRYIRRHWWRFLPIQTTCIRVTRSNLHYFRRRLLDAYLRNIRKKTIGATRVEKGQDLLNEIERLHLIPSMASTENGG